MTKFKVGDSVECVSGYYHITIGMTGTIRGINKDNPPVLVEWDQFEGKGHSGRGLTPNNNGYWVFPKHLKHPVFSLENE